MRTILTTALLILTTIAAIAQDQETNGIETKKMVLAGKQNIQYVGESSLDVADALFTHFNIKVEKPVRRIRKVQIEGIEKPITFQVHQGYHGIIDESNKDSKCKSGSYSHTFSSKHDQQWFETHRKPNETYAVWIYFKKGRDFGVESAEQYELIKSYISSICRI